MEHREHVWAVGNQFGFFSFKNQSNFVKSIVQTFGCKSQKDNSHWLKKKENLLAHITRHSKGGVPLALYLLWTVHPHVEGKATSSSYITSFQILDEENK